MARLALPLQISTYGACSLHSIRTCVRMDATETPQSSAGRTMEAEGRRAVVPAAHLRRSSLSTRRRRRYCIGRDTLRGLFWNLLHSWYTCRDGGIAVALRSPKSTANCATPEPTRFPAGSGWLSYLPGHPTSFSSITFVRGITSRRVLRARPRFCYCLVPRLSTYCRTQPYPSRKRTTIL